MLEGATQPGICWLGAQPRVEPRLQQRRRRERPAEADGRYVSFTVPLRGRFWFMDRHSVIGDVGIGFTHYRISADLEDGAGASGSYTRRTTPSSATSGSVTASGRTVARRGPRLAMLVGGLLHFTDLGDWSVDTDAGFANAAALQAAMDDETDDLSDLEPYAEVSSAGSFSDGLLVSSEHRVERPRQHRASPRALRRPAPRARRALRV